MNDKIDYKRFVKKLKPGYYPNLLKYIKEYETEKIEKRCDEIHELLSEKLSEELPSKNVFFDCEKELQINNQTNVLIDFNQRENLSSNDVTEEEMEKSFFNTRNTIITSTPKKKSKIYVGDSKETIMTNSVAVDISLIRTISPNLFEDEEEEINNVERRQIETIHESKKDETILSTDLLLNHQITNCEIEYFDRNAKNSYNSNDHNSNNLNISATFFEFPNCEIVNYNSNDQKLSHTKSKSSDLRIDDYNNCYWPVPKSKNLIEVDPFHQFRESETVPLNYNDRHSINEIQDLANEEQHSNNLSNQICDVPIQHLDWNDHNSNNFIEDRRIRNQHNSTDVVILNTSNFKSNSNTEFIPQQVQTNWSQSLNQNNNFITDPIIFQNATLSIQESILVNRKDSLMRKIEKKIKSLITDIANNRTNRMSFKMQTSNKFTDCLLINDVITLKNKMNGHIKRVCFMSRTSEHHYTVIVYLLCEIYKLLNTNSSSTKRELYYIRTELLRNQVCLNNGIKDICSMLRVYPWELGVNSSSKGTIAGDIQITTTDNYIINCKNVPGGVTIPNNIETIKKLETNAKIVLIVEKDAVFKRLLNDRIFEKLGINLILLTAKGYPDINSRYILKKIWDKFRLPIYILVDADPHGIEIMCTYKYGSVSLALHSDALAVPSIRWLGVHPSDIELLCLPVTPMTVEDHSKLKSLLKRPYATGQLLNELNILSRIDEKSEIESLSCLSRDYLLNIYIPRKIKADLTMSSV